MSGAFFGLDLALRALQDQQTVIDITNHNVANANTPGFSRQTAALGTTTPYTLPGTNRSPQPGQIGTGVSVEAIQRARDVFTDLQYRTESSTLERAKSLQDSLEQVEVTLNEPSDTGLSAQLAKFFPAWQELVNNPTEDAVRATLVQQSATLATSFNKTSQQLTALQKNLDDQVGVNVAQINSLANQIAAINRQIVQVEVTGDHANDFRDRRDLLLDQLSELIGITVQDNANGSINVSIGSHALIQNQTVDQLTTTLTAPGGFREVRFASDSSLVSLNGGKVQGEILARDQYIAGYLAKLDQVAGDLITAVNALHTTGYGLDGVSGRPFFSGSDAATMAVDPAIAADPRRVAAASAAGQPANSAVALQIAQLRHTLSPTPEGAYTALVSTLGVDSAAVRDEVANQTGLVQLLDRRRQSTSGVSLDEEAVNLVRFQRAYEAAARLITANDEMLDKLINETGRVGR